MSNGSISSVTKLFASYKLGTLFQYKKVRLPTRAGTLYRLHQLPIKDNAHEPRIRYLMNINDPHEVIYETNISLWSEAK